MIGARKPWWFEVGSILVGMIWIVWGVLLELWLGVGAGVLVIFAFAPNALQGIRSLRKGQAWESEPAAFIPLSLSTQMLLAVLFIGIPFAIWYGVTRGPLGAIPSFVVLAFGVLAYLRARWRERT